MKLTFGRKISYRPMLISVFIGLIIGWFLYLIAKSLVVSILFGLISFIVAVGLYALNLTRSFGYWETTSTGIKYYDYSSASKSLKAILMPTGVDQKQLKFTDIAAVNLEVGTGYQIPEDVKAAYASAYVVQAVENKYSSPYYLNLELKSGIEVPLDLSMNAQDVDQIKQVLALVSSKTHTKIGLIEA